MSKIRVYPVERREYYLNDQLVFSDIVACFSSYTSANAFVNSKTGQELLEINEPGYSRRMFVYPNGYELNSTEVEE